MARNSRKGSGGLGVFATLVIIGLIIRYFWWFVATVAVAGLLAAAYVVARAAARDVRERRAAAAREAEDLAYRADRQHQWARRGDSRGVYGVAGAELMRSISPELRSTPPDAPAEDIQVAGVATTKDGLAALLAEKTPCWRWAVFASVLVQRRAAVASRVRDCRLSYATPSGVRGYGGLDVRWFVQERIHDLHQLSRQEQAFMATPAFREVFGSPDDEATADAEGIVHVANRLMDYHDRFLALAERCRDYEAPSQYTDLMRDVRRLMTIPVESHHAFIDDFVDRVAELPELMRYGRGTIHTDPVVLDMDYDDRLDQRINRQLQEAASA